MIPGSLEIYEIYRMNVDGTDQRNLTNYPQADDSFPAWSDDGYLIFSLYDCFLVLNPKDLSMAQISPVPARAQTAAIFQIGINLKNKGQSHRFRREA